MAYRPYAISLNGRKYLVDTTKPYGRVSVPLQRPQADTSGAVGEQTLNPDDLWRRSFESWHRGAGQSVFDRSSSDPFRFDESLGVNPWTDFQLSLLGETENKKSSTAANVRLVVAGGYLYVADNQTLAYTQSVSGAGAATWTTVTGTPSAAINSIASDGYNVYTCHGSSGIYKTTRGGATSAVFHGVNCSLLDYVKGRLMAAQGPNLYNITSSVTPTTIAYTSYSTVTNQNIEQTGTAVTSLSLSTVVTRGPRLADPDRPDRTYSVAAGSVVFASLLIDSSGPVVTAPEGWTLIASDLATGGLSLLVYSFVVAENGDAAGTWTFDGSYDVIGRLVVYGGVDTSGPIDVAATDDDLGTASIPRPAVTVTNDGSMAVFFGATTNVGTVTPPSGMTERVDKNLASCGTLEIADVAANAGSLASSTATASATGGVIGIVVVIQKEIPAPLFTHDNTDFVWVGFAEGLNDIYAAGFSGDKSLIYKTQVRPDGTELAVPSVAGSLPDGEIVRSIYGYLGFVFVGSDKGLRMGQSDANGDLVFGSLIATPAPVRCFEGQDRFVWYGLENFDVSRWASGTYDGLGRLDLSQLVRPLTPAHASDLMVTGSTSTTEQVQSIATFGGVLVLSIADSGASLSRGVYAEKATKVANGYIDSGLVTYGIADTKVATYVDLRHQALVGSVQAYVSANEGTFTSVGTSSTASSTKPSAAFSVASARGETHEVRLRLARADSSDQVGPTVTRVTLRSEPAPSRSKAYKVTLRLFEQMEDENGQAVACNPRTEVDALFALFDTQTLVTFEDRGSSAQVFVRDIEFQAEKPTADAAFWQGYATVTLKEPAA